MLFFNFIAAHIFILSSVKVELLLSEANMWLIQILRRLLVRLIPTISVPNRDIPYILPKFIRVDWHFDSSRGKDFRSEYHRRVCFPLSLYFFDLNCLLPLHRSHDYRCVHLPSKIKKSCFSGEDGSSTNSEASLSTLMTEAKVSLGSDVMLVGVFAFDGL